MAKKCPLLKKNCIEHKCQWYTHLVGKNPQTGGDIDQYGCAVEWLPILLVELRQGTSGVQAATESFRNEMVKGNEKSLELQKQMMRLEKNESI